jgi:hypothetical protein
MRKFLILSIGLFLIFAVTMVIVYNTHPIVLKWLSGTARIIGKPINATVYTDGHPNNDIKVYQCEYNWDGKKTKHDNYYLLSLKEFDPSWRLNFINVDTNVKKVGTSICTANSCYDFVEGVLFQDQTGSLFVDFKDNLKGLDFDPNLAFHGNEIKFNIPPHMLRFDSIRIELNKK